MMNFTLKLINLYWVLVKVKDSILCVNFISILFVNRFMFYQFIDKGSMIVYTILQGFRIMYVQ